MDPVTRGILHSNPYESLSAVSQQPVNLCFGLGQTVSQQSPQRCEGNVLITFMGELVSNVAHPGPRATGLATDQATSRRPSTADAASMSSSWRDNSRP